MVGKYINGISTGGADTIKDINDVERIVLEKADSGFNVLFEGIRVHAGHARWLEAARKYTQHSWHFLILNTTIDQSMTNIRARLAAAGKGEPGPLVRNSVEDHWSRGQRQRRHFGLRCEYLSSDAAVERTMELLG